MESKGREGFSQVYQHYRSYVYQICLMILKKPVDAEDAMQETFMKYYIAVGHQKIESDRAWLAVVAKNTAISYWKKNRRYQLLGEEESIEKFLPPVRGVEEDFFDAMWEEAVLDSTDILLRVIQEKNKRWYKAIISIYCMGSTREATAEEMNITIGALDTMLNRAKKWIRENCSIEYKRIMDAKKRCQSDTFS